MSAKTDKKQREIWKKELDELAGNDFGQFKLITDLLIAKLKAKIYKRNIAIVILSGAPFVSVLVNILQSMGRL